ncbi:hypothetical protein LAWI1_G005630 [Lachnellula willkommii]|uniref:GST N-terminal domain-containing protein n=1 Tax=Lachnellula willkommii TaxID=215461 RepID=A0A559M382_9HELO|nr:hypothetical protein LAWI1_G005630 [Lachnellula willkommii]
MDSPKVQSSEQVSAILYHHPYSICSIMVRYTLAIRGAPKEASTMMIVEEQEVDIFHGAQLEEQYLCEVNPKGQVSIVGNPAISYGKTGLEFAMADSSIKVPVLASVALLPAPITDSLEITMYLAELYPNLQPKAHEQQIVRFLRDLHAINYFSLSYGTKPQFAGSLRDSVLQRMREPTTSQHYREALEYKLRITETEKVGGVLPAQVDAALKRTGLFLSHMEQLLVPLSGPWLFGLLVPTALDAHLVTFLARLRDLGRDELIPPSLRAYEDAAMETPEWRRVMNGRRTMYSG